MENSAGLMMNGQTLARHQEYLLEGDDEQVSYGM